VVIAWMADREWKHLVVDLRQAVCGKQATGWGGGEGVPCPDCLVVVHAWLDGAFDG
jgi:hypothetical protein